MEAKKNETQKTVCRISKSEYGTIKRVFKRLGCDSLVNYSDFFGNLLLGSYVAYFKNQPNAMKALAEKAVECDNSNRADEASSIRSFITSLERVNDLITTMSESSFIFDEAEKLCDSLDEAYYEYEGKAEK